MVAAIDRCDSGKRPATRQRLWPSVTRIRMGVSSDMIVRRVTLFLGIVAVIVGAVGLFAPASVSPRDRTVECGSVLSPDLSAARALDDGNAANIPVPGGVAVDTNYTQLCRMNLEDRRIWTITLAVVGAIVAAGALVWGARSNRAAPSP